MPLVATHDRMHTLPVVMVMHASLSASTAILGHPALSGMQSPDECSRVAALLWLAAGVVVIANRRRPPLATELLAHARQAGIRQFAIAHQLLRFAITCRTDSPCRLVQWTVSLTFSRSPYRSSILNLSEVVTLDALRERS